MKKKDKTMIEKLKLYTRVDQYGNNAVAVPPSIMEIKDKINELVDEMNRFQGSVGFAKENIGGYFPTEYKICYIESHGGFKSELVQDYDKAINRYKEIVKNTGKGKSYSEVWIFAVGEKFIRSFNGCYHYDGSTCWNGDDGTSSISQEEYFKIRLKSIYDNLNKNNETDRH